MAYNSVQYYSFLSTGKSAARVDHFSYFFRTTVSHLPLIICRPFVSPFVEKTDVGTYDIMFGRGWLCIIERGWLFWYSWAVRRLRWFVPLLQRKPARNVYIYYYNNNINILYIFMCIQGDAFLSPLVRFFFLRLGVSQH